MLKIPRIEIHGEAADGSVYILNKLDLENAKVRSNAEFSLETNLAMLRFTAEDTAMRWQRYLPTDKVRVTEQVARNRAASVY